MKATLTHPSRRSLLGSCASLIAMRLYEPSLRAMGFDNSPSANPETGKLQSHNVVVYREEGRYGGWPANGGIWVWGDEIVVVFTSAHYKPVKSGHAVDFDMPFEVWQARSTDGGETWNLEKPATLIPPELSGPKPVQLKTALEFEHPDFALMFKYTSQEVGPSRFYVSYDRCRTWQGPYEFSVPTFDKIAARTSYLVRSPHHCIMFGSMAKANDHEGRAFCAETTDGGITWKPLSRIGPEPEGYIIMPSTVAVGKKSFLTMLRHKDPTTPGSIDAYLSRDEGHTWTSLGKAASDIGSGNPPSLVALRDGRLALIYGYRAVPYGVRARISSDKGLSWGGEIVLRADGLTGDLGYPKSVQRADGRVVSVYYFNGPNDSDRTIQATIWKP